MLNLSSQEYYLIIRVIFHAQMNFLIIINFPFLVNYFHFIKYQFFYNQKNFNINTNH